MQYCVQDVPGREWGVQASFMHRPRHRAQLSANGSNNKYTTRWTSTHVKLPTFGTFLGGATTINLYTMRSCVFGRCLVGSCLAVDRPQSLGGVFCST